MKRKPGKDNAFIEEVIQTAATRTGLRPEDLGAIVKKGKTRTYSAGEWLFHESTPRLWMGVLGEGKVELVRGLHGSQVQLATLTRGALIGEGALLDHMLHSTSACTKTGVTVLEIPRSAWKPPSRQTEGFLPYCRSGGEAHQRPPAPGLGAACRRFRTDPLIGSVRQEHDLLG